MPTKRNLGIDLLRVLSIILITVIHYIGYSKVLVADDLLLFNKLFLLIVSSLATAAVNVFVLITGYFQSAKKVKAEKVFLLWAKILVASVILFVIGVLLGEKLSVSSLFRCFFPTVTAHYWFFVTYLLLLVVSPLLNAILDTVSQKAHLLFCVIAGLGICLLFVENPFISAEMYLGHYIGIVWFIYLYVVGAYFRKYEISVPFKWSLPLLIITVLMIFGLKFLSLNYLIRGNNALLPACLSVLLFLVFKEVKIKGKISSGILTKLSACSFFVYIIQEHCLIRDWYWRLWKIPSYAGSYFLLVNFVVAIIAVWPVAYLYDCLYEVCLRAAMQKLYAKLVKVARNGMARIRGIKS